MRLIALVLAPITLAAPAYAQAPTARELARVERILACMPLIGGHTAAPRP